MTEHKLKDMYATWDGYGIQCGCGATWEWDEDCGFTLDAIAEMARKHVEASSNDFSKST
jgi:hypothetical protein